MKVLDKPLWIFPGQQFRVCLQQPAGSGKLTVDVPSSLEMFDQWDQDEIQRYYFRGLKPGAATLKFSGKGGELEMKLEVIAWADIYTRRDFKDVVLPRIWPVDDPGYSELKSVRTLHSVEDLENLRKGGKVTERAERWLKTPDEDIYNIIPGPSVPRTCLMVLGPFEGGGVGKGCPKCGDKIYEGRSGFYPWVFDAEKHPWKVQCPECESWFPSNDWHKGDMHSGDFPDDGYGCEPLTPVKDANGRAWRYPFIAYYHQWTAYMGELTPGIIECARASVATGDKTYAHKAAVGLLRFAESMLDMSLNLNHRKTANRDGVYQWPAGAPIESIFSQLSSSFSYIQPNWDTPRMENAARAWDLIFDQLEGDEELLELCRQTHHPEIRTVEELRRFIDAGVIRAPVQMCLDKAVSRNYPMQEVTASTLALALGTPKTMDIVDYLLNESGVRFALSNQYYKDGSAHESPSYNHIQISDMARLFETLEKMRQLFPDLYQAPRFVSPMQDLKFRRQYDFPLEFTLIGRTYAEVGDTGSAEKPDPLNPQQGYPCTVEDWRTAWEATGDVRFAQAMYGPGGSLAGDISDEQLRVSAEEAGKELGWQVKVPSNILDGYGHAILRSGEGDNQRALWMRYARCVQHAHPDMLTYGLAGLKRDFLPELGYPQGWTFSGHWETNWGTHYGTHITGVRSTDFNKGELTTFVATSPAQVAAAECTATLEGQRALRQRLIALVDLSDDAFYALTIERVHGGEEHTFSFHGPDGEATPANLNLKPYTGTALGEGLKYGDFTSTEAGDPDLSCLALLREPSRDNPQGVWCLDYALRGQKDVHLRMTSVHPDDAELIVARGKAPGGVSKYDMTWAIQRSRGEAPLAGQYVNVLEPYTGESGIEKIERLPVSGGDPDALFPALALRVTAGEIVDTILLQHQAGPVVTAGGITFDGEFGLWRERDHKLAAATLVRGTKLLKDRAGVTLPEAEYRGEIVSCDWKNATITVRPAPASPSSLCGRHLRITNSDGSSTSYQIAGVEPVEDGCRIRLGLDPRIGEGFVDGCGDGVVASKTDLRLRPFDYYSGKTIANETGDVFYRLSQVAKQDCFIAEDKGEDLTAATLEAAFDDRDGDGLRRFLIYDYGPGDQVTIENFAALEV